jgi:hypothetical protein
MMEYNSVKNPVWFDSGHKMISVEVVFPAMSQTPVKFNASPDDCMDYGRTMYEELVSGKYGPIAEPSAG